jgi:hypothetical protein
LTRQRHRSAKPGGSRTVGVLRDSGSTKLRLTAAGPAAAARDELLEAVIGAAAGEFTVLGEIGRASDGTIAYLARDVSSKQLVALRLTHGAAAANEYLLEVASQLDTSVPAPPTSCPKCGAGVRGWARFCTQCGLDLWSDRSAGERWKKDDLVQAVQEATGGRFEILGEMNRSEGGGVVYFARDLETGKIEALRLQKETEREYSIGLTGVLNRFVAPIANYRPPRSR